MSTFFSKVSYGPVNVVEIGDSLCPYLDICIYDNPCTGLLDSGSGISIMGGKTFSYFSSIATLHSGDIDYITTANGSRSTVAGFFLLPVTVGEVSAVVKFYAIPTVTSELILGMNFWHAFNIAPEVLNLLSSRKVLQKVNSHVNEVRHLHPFNELSPSERTAADEVIQRFEDISFENMGLGRTDLINHVIDTGDASPIKQRYYYMSPERLKELNSQVDEMIELDVIEKSSSPWNSPVTMAPKSNGELRFCLDSRKLNEVSKHDAYPLPYIHSILDQLRDARYLSSIDLKAAFWQIPLSEDSKEKTAFTVPARGLFQFKVMCLVLLQLQRHSRDSWTNYLVRNVARRSLSI